MPCGSHIANVAPQLLALTAALFVHAVGWPQQGADLSGRDMSIRKVEPPSKHAAAPHGYALIIGISKYENLDPADNLRFPESDAQGIYRVLISKEAGGLPAENVHLLIGRQATREAIHQQIDEWLPSVAHAGDTVVVFFAGHGFSADGRGYFAPWDVDPRHLAETGFSMTEFGRTLETKVQAKNKVLLVDACRSAKVTRGMADSSSAQQEVNSQLGKLSNSFLTFVAARENDRSFEDPQLGNGAGLFSYFLIRGLQGDADQNPCDGVVTADELIEYVRTKVREYAHERGESQTPTDYGDFDPNMVLALSSKCGSTVSAEDVRSGDLVVEANMDGVDVYLDDHPVGSVSKDKPLRLAGIATGVHTVMGVRKGYEADTQEIAILPGQERSVTLRIQYPREYKKSSKVYMDNGEKLLFSQKSSFNPLDIYSPVRQTRKTFDDAQAWFEKALAEDAKNARAAYDLGLTYLYLSDDANALAAFRRAVSIDPTYLEAKMQYAGELIESGDPDKAIRHLTDVVRAESKNDVAHSYLARAYCDKFVWNKAIDEANQALALRPANEQAYLWKGVALRQLAAGAKDPTQKLDLYKQAGDCFESFVRMTNFSSPAYQQIPFYLVGFGLGRRSHADRVTSYKLQRSIAFDGLCDSENKLGHSARALDYCQQALRCDDKDPVTYFLLGHVHRDLFNRNQSKEELLLARDSYQRVVELNPDLQIARNARAYLDNIQALLETLAARAANH